MIATGSKWVHNNVAWPFMIGLVMVIPFWIVHNIPSKIDIEWFMKAGGLFSRGVHPPARKFNAGQKLIFWSVVIFGLGISVTGISLLFPFQFPIFAPTFEFLNSIGFAAIWGEPLPTQLTPHEEMQLASLWHGILAFVLMAIVLAHIYLGSFGMEGAFDAMGSGDVDLQWAKEHHGLWVKEEEEKARAGSSAAGAPKATPAE